MSSNERPRRRRGKRTAALLVLAIALGLGWYLRDWLNLGLGTGLGGLLGPEAPGSGEDVEPAPESEAELPGNAPALPPPPCELYLDSGGLTLGGKPASIEEAVGACEEAGKARLRATGGARAGTYDELIRALDQAGVTIEDHSS